MDILQKLDHLRQEESKLKWEGTFAEYLDILKERKEVAQTAHSRVYNMIKSAGVQEKNGHKMYRFFGKEIFSFVFSAQWEVAGSYAQILSVWIFFVFISSPISNLLFVQERQKEALILQIVIFVSRLMVLSACALFHLNAFQTVFYFGLTGALIFFGFIFYLLSSIGIKKTKIIKHSFFTIILGVLPIFLFKKFIWSLL